MYGVVCLSILLEGGVTVSNNFTKRRQNGFKTGTRDKSETHLRYENFVSNEISYLRNFIIRSVIFTYNSLFIHKLSHTPRILSLGSLWILSTESKLLVYLCSQCKVSLCERNTHDDSSLLANVGDNCCRIPAQNLCHDLLTIWKNTYSDLKVHALHYANELLVRVRLAFQNLCKLV